MKMYEVPLILGTKRFSDIFPTFECLNREVPGMWILDYVGSTGRIVFYAMITSTISADFRFKQSTASFGASHLVWVEPPRLVGISMVHLS